MLRQYEELFGHVTSTAATRAEVAGKFKVINDSACSSCFFDIANTISQYRKQGVVAVAQYTCRPKNSREQVM
jgi:hypothetical protein